MKVCEQHKTTPALIYGECIGCELEGLRADVKRLKAESDQILNDAIANIDRKAARIMELERTAVVNATNAGLTIETERVKVDFLRASLKRIVAGGESDSNFPQDGRMFDIAKNALAESV